MKKFIELTLPEFAFLKGFGSDDDWCGRNVILHVRSASVVEVFFAENAFLKEDTPTITFTMSFPRISDPDEIATQTFVLALHHSPLLDINADRELIVEEIMKPCAEYFKKYQEYLYKITGEEWTRMTDMLDDCEERIYDSFEDEDDDEYYVSDYDDEEWGGNDE